MVYLVIILLLMLKGIFVLYNSKHFWISIFPEFLQTFYKLRNLPRQSGPLKYSVPSAQPSPANVHTISVFKYWFKLF